MQHIEYKYFDPQKAPERHQILTPLYTSEGLPAYCSETLPWVETEEDISGTSFNVAVKKYYDMIYAYLTEGTEMPIKPEQVLTQLKVIDKIHAQNPLPLKED